MRVNKIHMQRIAAFLFLIAIICTSAFAQTLSAELDKIKQIKLLESTREDVERILSGYKGKHYAVGLSQTFSSKKIEIEVSYTRGDCPDGVDKWNIEKGKVDFIDISFNDPVKFEDLKYNASDFRKERMPVDKEDAFVYHDKNKGIVFLVEKEKLTSIFLMPSRSQSSLLCNSEESKKLKEFYSRESYFEIPARLQK